MRRREAAAGELMRPQTTARCQVEAFLRFFLGTFDVDLTYDDDLLSVARKNVCSPSGFWFDCVTSIPWSYMDLHFYLVPSHLPLTHTRTPHALRTHLSTRSFPTAQAPRPRRLRRMLMPSRSEMGSIRLCSMRRHEAALRD